MNASDKRTMLQQTRQRAIRLLDGLREDRHELADQPMQTGNAEHVRVYRDAEFAIEALLEALRCSKPVSGVEDPEIEREP